MSWSGSSSNSGNGNRNGGWRDEDESYDFSKVAGAAAATAAVAGGLFALFKSSSSSDPEPAVAFGARGVRKPETSRGVQILPYNDDGDSDGDDIENEDYEDSTTGGWSFPPYGWIKCNVDGSAPPDKLSGCGGVFRDSNGSWLYGFARSFHRCDSSAAELEGIYTGLDIAWKQGFRRLILETDSRTAADVVNNNNGASARKLHEKKLVQKIKDLLENREWDPKPMIVHSNRDGNKVADWLADLSHGLKEGDQLELSKFPYGCRSCQELMLRDTRVAKAGRSCGYGSMLT